jgi:uncharacterized protein DUF4136
MNLRNAALVFALVPLMGCSAATVSADFNPAFDFADFRSWMWIDDAPRVNDVRIASDIVAGRIRSATEAVLEEKGFRLVTSNPDFEVGWMASVEDRVNYNTYNTAHPRGRYGTYWTSQTVATPYTEGTLVIDVFDADNQELVWRGIGEGKARFDRDPEGAEKQALKVMREILGGFPPGR